MLLYTPFAMCTMEVTALFNITNQLQIVFSPPFSFTVTARLCESHSDSLMLSHSKSTTPDAIWPSNSDFHEREMCPKWSGTGHFPAVFLPFLHTHTHKAFGCKYVPLFRRHLESALKTWSFLTILEHQNPPLASYNTKQLLWRIAREAEHFLRTLPNFNSFSHKFSAWPQDILLG